MAKNPAFPFYAADFLVDTLRWKRDMKSLHVDLLCECWCNGQLVDDNGHPAGLEGEDLDIWNKIKHKWVLVDGAWYNEKLEECREKREKYVERLKENGKKGGRPKSDKKANGLENENQKETNSFFLKNQKQSLLEKENEYEKEIENNLGKGVQGENPLQVEAEKPVLQKMLEIVKRCNTNHISDSHSDFRELREIAEKLAGGSLDLSNGELLDTVVQRFETLYQYAMQHELYSKFALPSINKHLSAINQAKNSKNVTIAKNRKPSSQYIPTDTDYASSFHRGNGTNG